MTTSTQEAASARHYATVRRLATAFKVLGWVGVGWGVVLVTLSLSEIHGWIDGVMMGAFVTIGVGCCLAAFAASAGLRLALDLATRAGLGDER
ncbi:MAG: hypothetical protein ACOX3S_04375 [Anaerolineae bacterium]|jgi:hypothetical protein